MKQENRMSLKPENTIGIEKQSFIEQEQGIRHDVPLVVYQGKPLDLTSIFNLVKSRTPLYYMSENPNDNFCEKFIPAKLVYEQDKDGNETMDLYGNETMDLYDVDGKHWYTHFHRALYTDRQEAFDEWYQKQMRLIERARAKLLELEKREENIEVMRQLNENQ